MTGTNITYEWDAENRLHAIDIYVTNTATMQRSEFTYDGYSRWCQIVEKSNGVVGSTKRFVWSGGATPSEERDGSNTTTKRFFAEGEQIGGTNYYFMRDRLGSVRELIDSANTVHTRYDYDPYGRQTKTSGDLDADFGFAGYYHHAPSGLDLTLFRAYDPDSGRWINRDPIAEAGGLNLYGYVGNGPIDEFDPDGLSSIWGDEWQIMQNNWRDMQQGWNNFVANTTPFINAVNQQIADAMRYPGNGIAGSEFDGFLMSKMEQEGFMKCMPKLGWSGSRPYREALRKILSGGDVDLGFVPTTSQAMQLLKDAGIDTSSPALRIEGPHGPPSTHDYPHINYPTPNGGRGTVRTQ